MKNLDKTVEEEAMSFDKVKSESLKVEMGVILVNGVDIREWSDAQLIKVIKAEREKRDTLEKEVGSGSKYFQAKKTAMELNIQVLLDALDARVAYD